MPDLFDALTGITGVRIRVRHELPEASQRLMDSLGVIVEVDPSAPECERFHDRTGERQRCRRCARVERAADDRVSQFPRPQMQEIGRSPDHGVSTRRHR